MEDRAVSLRKNKYMHNLFKQRWYSIYLYGDMYAARDKMMQILRMKRKQKLKMASRHSCFLLIYKLSRLMA